MVIDTAVRDVLECNTLVTMQYKKMIIKDWILKHNNGIFNDDSSIFLISL